MPLRKMCGPSDIAAKSSATAPSVTTATVRRIQTTSPKNRMTRPQPKNAFSSAAFCASRSAITEFPATERLRVGGEGGQVGAEAADELRQAVVALRAEELHAAADRRARAITVPAATPRPRRKVRASPRCRRRRASAMTAQKMPRPTAVMKRISRLMNACQISRPARISPLRSDLPARRSSNVRQMISGTQELRDDVRVTAGVRRSCSARTCRRARRPRRRAGTTRTAGRGPNTTRYRWRPTRASEIG